MGSRRRPPSAPTSGASPGVAPATYRDTFAAVAENDRSLAGSVLSEAWRPRGPRPLVNQSRAGDPPSSSRIDIREADLDDLREFRIDIPQADLDDLRSG